MTTYHLNPFTGNPNKCRAKKGNCPWGGENEHYLTQEAARFAYELQMKEEELAASRKAREESLDAYASRLDPTYAERLSDRMLEHAQREREEEEREADYLARLAALKADRPHLSREQAMAINTDGITCPREECGQQLTPLQASLILNEMYGTACKKCGVEFGLYDVSISVGESKDTYAAFELENVKAMTWYHSTTSKTWGDELKTNGGFYAHLGSQQAAFDRQIAESYTATSSNRDSFYLFEVEVEEDVKIGSRIDMDENQDYNFYHPENKPLRQTDGRGSAQSLEGPVDVVRYVNKWEDMASISLVAATPKLKIKSMREVTRDEALASPSLYNISEDMAKEETAPEDAPSLLTFDS